MKWFCIILLLLNILYLGWEINKETRIHITDPKSPFKVPPDAKKLILLSELTEPPEQEPINIISLEQADQIENRNLDAFVDKESVENMPIINNDDLEWKTSNESLCVSYGPFSYIKEAENIKIWLDERNIFTKQRKYSTSEEKLFWVYISPNQSKEDALEKIESLKKKNITDYRFVNEGDMKNAISLGVFSSKSSANRRLKELTSKGFEVSMIPNYEINLTYFVDAIFKSEQVRYNEMLKANKPDINTMLVNCNEIVSDDQMTSYK